MEKRIKDKIKEVEQGLSELYSIFPDTLEDYKKDFKTKAACERYVEKIIESVIDLAYLLIKKQKLKIPNDDTEALAILNKNNIISETLMKKLKDAKGMRNIIAHEYGKIEEEIVFDSIKGELKEDIEGFLEAIGELI